MARILVVDDEKDILFLMQEALGAHGHEVTGAVSGFEAFDYLSQNAVDLLILDLHMPDLTGLEFLERFRRSHTRVPVIICSGYTALSDDYTVWTSHVAAFVRKPLDIEHLVRQVNGVLDRRKELEQGAC